MSVLENVMIGRHTRSRSGFFSGIFSTPRSREEERTIYEKSIEVIELLGISELIHDDAESLPFGKQRMVEFARALAMEPELLILDEPAAGLNIHETEEMAEMITRIREWGITVLIIEHDMSLIMDISDQITVLSSGTRIAEGKPEEIQKNKDVIKVYLGEEDA
jgi:branched-chain amino acid transport system ATP-binding protein